MKYTTKTFWDKFGAARFTNADLWAAFGHGSFPGFPTPEWLDEIGIGRVSWIENAPGRRGGEGWKLTEKAVAKMQAQQASAQARQEQLQALLAVVKPRLGECRCAENDLHWVFLPVVDLPGHHPNGRRRYGSKFELSWPASATAAHVQQQLDRAAIHIADLAKKVRERRLAELTKLDALIAKVSPPG